MLEQGREQSRFGLWLAHRRVGLALAMIPLITIGDAVMWLWGPRSTVSWLWLIALIAPFMAFYYGQQQWDRHQGSAVCQRCVDATPLDGPEQAYRHVDALRWAHWRAMHPQVVGFATLGLLAAAVVLGSPVNLTGYAVVIELAVTAWAWQWHDRLAPWCPFCHDDDRGDEDEVPEPSPEPGPAAEREATR